MTELTNLWKTRPLKWKGTEVAAEVRQPVDHHYYKTVQLPTPRSGATPLSGFHVTMLPQLPVSNIGAIILMPFKRALKSQGNIDCPSLSHRPTLQPPLGNFWLPWCGTLHSTRLKHGRLPQNEKNVQAIVAKEQTMNMKQEAQESLSLASVCMHPLLYSEGNSESMEIPKRI